MKELIALLLLALLLGGALLNIEHLEDFTTELTESLDESRESAEAGDWDAAEAKLRGAIESWNRADGYTHIFIRHAEIDGVSDSLYELLSEVLAQDMGAAAGAYEKAIAHLESIYTMERVSVGSVF